MTYKHPDVKVDSTEENAGTAATDNRKRPVPGSSVCIYNLRTKQQRRDMFQATLPECSGSDNLLDIHSRRAQMIHKSIFEEMVMDLLPFTEV